MSGKPYTMREMKGIVDYLVEHKAYNEIKGRKMWINFASSQMTTRTWQSLKETFLKRILPDIYNPYYKLTMEQARSFKEGRDIEEKKQRNKLEIQTLSDTSNPNNGENQKNGEQPSTSKAQTKEAEVTSGEVIKCAKIPSEPRSSADTVVLEAYYNNAEEIKNVLEENIDSEKNDEEYNKNIRDCLTFEYSPFNIDAMKVLEDFATESEGSDKERSMEIDENPSSPKNVEKPENRGNEKIEDDAPIEIHDSDTSDLENNEKDSDEVYPIIIEELNRDTGKDNSQTNKQKETTEDQDTDKQKETTEEQDDITEKDEQVDLKAPEDKTEYITVVDNTEHSDTIIPPNRTASPKKSVETVSYSITPQMATNSSDASLPNNQEALKGVINTQSKLETSEDKTVKNKPRKRSTSTDMNTSKKVKLDNENFNKTDKIEEIIENLSTKEKMDVVANGIETNSENLNNPTEVQNTKESNQNDQEQTNNDEIKDNPCLNSVSLYAEQFNTTKYSDSDNEVETVNQKPQENTLKNSDSENKVKTVNEKPQENTDTIETQGKADNELKKPQIKVYNKSTKPHAIADNKLNLTQDEIENTYSDHQENAANTSNKEPEVELSLKKPSEPKKDDNKSSNKDEVIILKSHSDSVSDKGNPGPSKVTIDRDKARRESNLANMLGFLGGGNRKRRISHKRPRTQRHSTTLISDSSEWTSESDDEEYVSPPRGRMNRHSKKYLKPKSARILSLDEEGGLFVFHGKRMFPVVKDGRIVKNYVALNTDSNSEEEENSYWKQKYVYEKIRADELEKRLKEVNNSVQKPDPTLERKSPILQSNTLLRNISSYKPHNEPVGDSPKIQEITKDSPKKQSSQEKLKICFSKNNQEVQLEGYWSTLHPALQQVVQLLHTEDETKLKPPRRPSAKKTDKSAKTDRELETVEIDSGKTSPNNVTPTVDPEVHEKISKIESEIFREIEDLESKAKEEEQELKPAVEVNSNVTKRPARGRPKKSALSTSKVSSIKKEKSPKLETEVTKKDSASDKIEEKQIGVANETANTVDKPQEQQNSEQNGAENETAKNVEKPREKQNEEQNGAEAEAAKNVEKPQEKQNEAENEAANNVEKPQEKQNGEQNEAEDEASKNVETASNISKRSSRASKRYSEEKTIQNRVTTRRSASRKIEPTPTIDDEENVRYMLPPNETKQTNKRAKRSLAEACTQDASLRSIDSTQGYQDSDISPILTKRKKRERKSSFRVHSSKRLVRRKSLPNLTAMVASDSSNSSYFVPLRKNQSTLNSEVYRTDSYQLLVPQSKTIKVLQSIEEDQISDEIRHFDSVSRNESDRSSSCNAILEVGSSSNVSLPMSPELSVVENLTISREMIKDITTLNEICNVSDENLDYNKYVMSDVDVTYPLMAGQCELQQSNNIKSPNSIDKSPPAIEFLNKKVAQVNIEDKSISDTINKKLHDLLLESAKKITNGKENMEIDQIVEATEIPKKTRSKKRCSTPRKRTTSKKKAPVNPVIEEEHMESCSFGGRKSCPPLINIITPEDDPNSISETIESKESVKVKGKKKKDVIKVKIQRPRSRSKDSRSSKDSAKTSILTDSGINETGCLSGMLLKGNDSVDLIHNHSDTCLHANECIGDDSIEFVENSKSIISLNNSSDSELMKLIDDVDKFSGTLECNDAQDGFMKHQPITDEHFYSATATEYQSPINTNSSLITEDLSDEVPSQPTKWYLLSDEDTNTNIVPPSKDLARSFGANLNQIFTSCAVPNLSTITERSNDSKKVNLETDADSQSLF